MEKSYSTCLEMFQQRQYVVQESDSHSIVAKKPDGTFVIAFFTAVPKLNIKNIQVLINQMIEMKIYHAIVVYQDSVTSFTRKAIDKSRRLHFQFLAQKDLQYNITKHRLQPAFSRLSPEDAKSFKEKFGTGIARMNEHDPIAQFYDYRKGDIIRIVRSNNYVTYRIVG